MSKLANIDSAQSTEYLTSMINGFKLETEDVMGVIDKLVAVKYLPKHMVTCGLI